MEKSNRGTNANMSAVASIKRKRGRPRKYPKLDVDQGGSARIPREQNLSGHVSPGFVEGRRYQPGQTARGNIMIGQVVHGVIDAAFDAGYLITARVGNSDTTLRGVVFKAGHYVPISADNDVAPGVQMIQRNEVSLPKESNNSRTRDRNGTGHVAASTFCTPESKRTPSLETAYNSAGISRGNMVPMMFHPVNLPTEEAASHPSNGLPPVNHGNIFNNQAPLHMRASNSGLAGMSPVKEASHTEDDDDSESLSGSERALSAEPLQAVQPAVPTHTLVMSRPLENYRTGKMTELLQVLQESMIENQKIQAEEMASSSRSKSDETDRGEEDGSCKRVSD